MKKNIRWTDLINRISLKNVKRGFKYLQYLGPRKFLLLALRGMQPIDIEYENWYRIHKISNADLKKQKKNCFEYNPLISILVPVYNPPESFLRQMINSVCEQSYSNWELCIANADPSNRVISDILYKASESDKRVKVINVPENEGIAQNTNAALNIATGDYVGLLDHDDLLTPNALYEMVAAINDNFRPQVLYSDEDKVSADLSRHFQPNFKPDFNEDLLCSNNYITHFFVVEKIMIKQVGGFDGQYNGAQDYDIILKCTEQAKKIVHIPKILYHWRVHDMSTSERPESKMYAYDAGKRAIEAHLKRKEEDAEVFLTEKLGFYNVQYHAKEESRVSIIIISDEYDSSLQKCINSIRESLYKDYEVIIIGKKVKKTITKGNIRFIRWEKEHNLSSMYNFAVDRASGKYILFLDKNITLLREDCIQNMEHNCERPGVGIVGARIYSSKNKIWHAGITVGLNGSIGYLFQGAPKEYNGYMNKIAIQQDLSAVSMKCMMIKKELYKSVNGFDEKFKNAFMDVDLCLKVGKKNFRIIYNPNVEAKLNVIKKLKKDDRIISDEENYFKEKWEASLQNGDSMYNANFSLTKNEYSLNTRK